MVRARADFEVPDYGTDPWVIEIRGIDAARIGINETLLALSNGRIGVRGSFEQGAPSHQPGTLVNGFHETWTIEYPEAGYGYAKCGQTIVYVPDATQLEAHGLSLAEAEVVRRLDLRSGVLTTTARWPGQTLTWQRLVSLARAGIVAFRLTKQDGSARVTSGWRNRQDTDYLDQWSGEFDPRRAKSFGRRVLVPVETLVERAAAAASFRTERSEMPISVAMIHDRAPDSSPDPSVGVDQVEFPFDTPLLEKKVAYLSVDKAEGSLAELERTPGFSELADEQETRLAAFWNDAAIEIGGDPRLQQAVNWILYQLYQASALVEGSGIPAKGLTGQAYEGHYFWDTEIFVLPFLAHAHPRAAKELIKFRHSLLPAARERARVMAEKGALYPWRTINGEEASAYYEAGTAQYHINGAVIYGVDSYLTVTGDDDLLWECGVEMAVETARLWAGLGFFDEGSFHIHMVTGPDEYSALVDDNAYTNLIARFGLRRASEWTLRMQREQPARFTRLAEQLKLGPDEIEEWERTASAMYVPQDRSRGLTPQDARFLEREQWDWSTPADQYPLLLHFHPLVIYRHQVLKQADVVMAMYLFPDEFDAALTKANFDYYDPITTSDSSLSPPIQAAVAARLGDTDLALDYLKHAAFLDLANLAGNTADGVHLATAGGVWHALVGGFAGLKWKERMPMLDPHLPAEWTHIHFSIRVGGSMLRVEIDHESVSVRTDDGAKVDIEVMGERHTIDSAGRRVTRR
jgi:alpha,alpha-trehalose phosphorylase